MLTADVLLAAAREVTQVPQAGRKLPGKMKLCLDRFG